MLSVILFAVRLVCVAVWPQDRGANGYADGGFTTTRAIRLWQGECIIALHQSVDSVSLALSFDLVLTEDGLAIPRSGSAMSLPRRVATRVVHVGAWTSEWVLRSTGLPFLRNKVVVTRSTSHVGLVLAFGRILVLGLKCVFCGVSMSG